MGNFTVVPDVSNGQSFPPSLWESSIMNNLNLGVTRQLADTTLGAGAATVVFSSIPATFAHLLLMVQARGDTAAATTGLALRMNGDTGANYADAFLQGVGPSSATAGQDNSATSMLVGAIAAASATANHPGSLLILIPSYAGTTFFKQAYGAGGYTTALTTGAQFVLLKGGVWASTAAVNSLTFFAAAGNLIAGTRLSLYGLPA